MLLTCFHTKVSVKRMQAAWLASTPFLFLRGCCANHRGAKVCLASLPRATRLKMGTSLAQVHLDGR